MGLNAKGKVTKPLLIDDKVSISAYKEASWSTKNVFARVGCDKASMKSVSRLLQRPHWTMVFPCEKKGSGGPRKIILELLVTLKRQIKKYPAITAGQLQQ